MNWELLANTLAILAAGSGLIVYLAKKLSSHLLARDLERFKSDLKSAHDSALERLRTDLRIQAFEREITFSRLHDKRVQVIEELYKRISTVSLAMNRLISDIKVKDGPSLRELADNAAKAGDDFLEYYLQHQIYFDEVLCEQLQAFNGKIHDAWIKFGISNLTEDVVAHHQQRLAAWAAISEEAPKIRLELERAFRTMLGHKADASSDRPSSGCP